MSSDCWVLWRQTDGHEEITILGVYTSVEDVETRVARIAKANKQYPLVRRGSLIWSIGPNEDEGFFGNKPITIFARKTSYYRTPSAYA